MIKRLPSSLITAFAFIALAGSALGAEISFNREIRPILSDKCYACHGPDGAARKADLRLDGFDFATAKLDSGKSAIMTGNPDASELVARIVHSDPKERMPPRKTHKKVTKAETEKLRQWIAGGAEFDSHWSFKPISKPPFPELDLKKLPHGFHPENAIDLFVMARLQRENLIQQGQAADHTLLRRIALDLTGLPPTPEQIDEFAKAAAKDFGASYERAIDDLLRSPHYGEHMAWQWLDAARYGDSDGYESDPLRNMWPWRDWVVDAFNLNLPYNQFIIEQLAGDLLPNPSMRQVVATGFNRNHRLNNEGGVDPEEWLIEDVADRAETTATVFMGLTWQCARCHDHKYDPITQRDYYQMFAFFHNVPEVGNGRGSNAPPALDVPALPHMEAYEALLEKLVPLEGKLAALKKQKDFPAQRDAWIESLRKNEGLKKKLPGDLAKKPIGQWDGKLNSQAADFFLKNHYPPAADLRKTMRPLEVEANRLRTTGSKVMVMAEMPEPRKTHILERGAFNKPLGEVTASSPAFLPPMDASLPKNRLGLAKWLTDPKHPLTARVIVNRIWERFFGIGLVKTQEDFGSQGEPPLHPELLDYLATWLIEHGWNLKALQKEILMSATYRQSSAVTQELLERDPENRLFARGPRYRLPAAVIRDQAMAASGLLVGDIGGPPVKPYQPAGLWKEIIKGRVEYKRDSGEKLYRRSLYVLWRRAVKPPMMMLLDSNERDFCAVNQKRTNTPLQALLLMNDVTFVEAARAMAGRMILEGGEQEAGRIAHGMLLAAARPPTGQEAAILSSELKAGLAHYRNDIEAAKALITIGESKPDPSLDPAELAAYTNVARVLLNLDETLNKE